MMRPAPKPAPPKPAPPKPTPQKPAAPVTSRDRLEWRRRLLWWLALPALLVLCLSAKRLSVGILADTAARSFAAGDAGAVADAAAGLRMANFVEPQKAPFAEGDGLFLAGDFAAARQRFEEALSLAGTADECVVRVNLALTIERLGTPRPLQKIRRRRPGSSPKVLPWSRLRRRVASKPPERRTAQGRSWDRRRNGCSKRPMQRRRTRPVRNRRNSLGRTSFPLIRDDDFGPGVDRPG